MNYEVGTFHSSSTGHKQKMTPGPFRFNLPDADDIVPGIFSLENTFSLEYSFSNITYSTKPIIQASDMYKKGSSFCKRLPDRNSKNDTTEDEDEDEDEENQSCEENLRDTNSDDDWSILKNYPKSQGGSSKRVRFDLEKEDMEKFKTNDQTIVSLRVRFGRTVKSSIAVDNGRSTEFTKIEDEAKTLTRSVIAVSKPATLATEAIVGSISSTSILSGQPLPGRKLSTWKRKLDESPPTPAMNYEVQTFHSSSSGQKQDTTPGPSRFDLPEADDIVPGVFFLEHSFSDITYSTKPIIQASDMYEKGNSSCRRLSDRDNKNDTTEDEDEENRESEKNLRDANSDDDWSIPKNYPKSQDDSFKQVCFGLEEDDMGSKTNDYSSTDDSINNHVKIIREVLKKNSHLVKNKNICLKITHKKIKSSDAMCKTKVSYVILNSDHLSSSKNDGNDSNCNGNIDGERPSLKYNKCDLNDKYTSHYRRHIQDVRKKKFDLRRICEHCGYEGTKRLLIYHLYAKHNISPPKDMCFPKCQECSYVALTKFQLVRHQLNYNHRPASRHRFLPMDPLSIDGIQCSQCNQSFRCAIELISHELNTGHNAMTDDKKSKGNICPYCDKVFMNFKNLTVHLATRVDYALADYAHKNLQRETTESSSSAPAILLEPSSEAEALSHVTSDVATSLGVRDTETVEIIAKVASEDQYIVPDMLEDMPHNINYNEHDLENQHMIVLVDNDENYQHVENSHHQQLLDIADNEEIVMDTDNGVIVYVQDEEADHRSTFKNHQSTEGAQKTEERIEEIVEIVKEEVVEEKVQEVSRNVGGLR